MTAFHTNTMRSEVMQTQCSYWDAGSREENNVSANTFFSEASERIFSENVGKELDVFLLILAHSPVRNCQVGLWRTLVSEFSLLHQPCWEQAVRELGTLGLPDSLPQSRGSCGLSSEEELCSQLGGRESSLSVCPGSGVIAEGSQEIHSSCNAAN